MIDNSFFRRLKFAWKFITSRHFANWTVFTLKYAFSTHEKIRGNGSTDVIIWSAYLDQNIFSKEDISEFYKGEETFKVHSETLAELILKKTSHESLKDLTTILSNKIKAAELLTKIKKDND